MGTSHISESRCIFKLKRVWRVCLQTGDWVKLWNASDMSCVLYVLFSVFTEEEILIFKLFQMSAGSAENNLQSHQELRVTGKPPGSWKTRKLFHLRAESCGRGCSWGVEGSSGRWMLGVLPSVWSALSQAPNPRTPGPHQSGLGAAWAGGTCPSQMGLGELLHPLPPRPFHELHPFPAPSKSAIYRCLIQDFEWLPSIQAPCWIFLKLQAGWGAAFGNVIDSLQSSCPQEHLWESIWRCAPFAKCCCYCVP